MMAALEAARDALALIPGITSCKIGTEDGISPADFPLIRIEPLRVTPGQPYGKRTCEVVVHFGLPVGQSDADVPHDGGPVRAAGIGYRKPMRGFAGASTGLPVTSSTTARSSAPKSRSCSVGSVVAMPEPGIGAS